MTNEVKSLKNGQIKFKLEVTTTIKRPGDKNNPIDFKLDLNPDENLIGINECLSTKEDLIIVFKRITKLLEIINNRTEDYSKATDINTKVAKEVGFITIYEDNFKPPFEKIDRIIYRHESPGTGTVSYARSYNGDKKPEL